jgi:hypothetical protein
VYEWGQYLLNAPADDRWIPLARVRLEAVQREQERMKKAFEVQRKQEAAKKPAKDTLQVDR